METLLSRELTGRIDRAFLYGDLIFETIRIRNGEICFTDKHYNRLSRGAHLLKFDTGALSKELFEEEIYSKLNGRSDARVRYVLYRDSEGFYTPEQHSTASTIELFPLDTTEKICETMGVYSHFRRSCNELSNLKSGNALIQVLAGIYANENHFDDCLVLNEHGRVAEAISSNIFILQGQELITPPLSEGCVEGVMRQVVIETAIYRGVDFEEAPIQPHDLIQADEVFLTNAINGIVAVKSFNFKKYPSTFSSYLKSFTGF